MKVKTYREALELVLAAARGTVEPNIVTDLRPAVAILEARLGERCPQCEHPVGAHSPDGCSGCDCDAADF